MSEILHNSYYKTGSVAYLSPTNLQRSIRRLNEMGFIVKTTPLRRGLYYINKQSELAAFISSDGDTMFFNNQLAKIFVCCGHVWTIFYRPNGKQLK